MSTDYISEKLFQNKTEQDMSIINSKYNKALEEKDHLKE